MKTGAGMERYDLVIVGGGIGGGALACVMAEAGRSVLVLERTEVFEDLVRGEWIAPWGVTEARRTGLLDLLLGAGGHFLTRHVTFNEAVSPAMAEAAPLPLGIFAPDVPGPLCIGHPHHCQTLLDEAARRGATVARGVDIVSVKVGAEPSVTFTAEGEPREASARLVVGADGRNSAVREACGLTLHADRPHHFIGGLLVEGVEGVDEDRQMVGVEGALHYLCFPQGGGRVRLYGCYPLEDRAQFSGPEGAQRFLDAFRLKSCPDGDRLAAGRPAGPVRAYANNDAWTESPYAPGAALIGDAAGWNDPVVGQGLSISYRDVRIVSDLLKGSDDWSNDLFAPYAEERAERMRRLRFAAMIVAELDVEFGEAAQARRLRHRQRATDDQSLMAHVMVVMGGPELAPPEVFTPAYRERVMGA
jgi:2-polyprenyl-6-methoxyphenol hydroxylase-like FAD-dependent oxidoreductase